MTTDLHHNARDAARIRARLNEGGMMWQRANAMLIRLAELEGREPTAEQRAIQRRGWIVCPALDPRCPCNDGDLCHYEEDPAAQLARWVLDGYGEAA